MINYNKNIPKFTTIKELVYHSATVFSNNIAFTTKQKKDDNITYINHTYSDLLNDINSFGTSLYKLGLKNKISTCMEICIFDIIKIIDLETVKNIMKETNIKRFSHKGDNIIKINNIFINDIIIFISIYS